MVRQKTYTVTWTEKSPHSKYGCTKSSMVTAHSRGEASAKIRRKYMGMSARPKNICCIER